MDQLFCGGVLKSYEYLQNEFGLSVLDFFRFLQIRHYLQTHVDWEQICRLPTNLENTFLMTIEGVLKKNLISHLYQGLQDYIKGNTIETKQNGNWK